VLGTIGDAIKGQKPNQPVAYPLEILPQTAGIPATEGMGGAPSTGLAAIGLRYVGHPYKFGGAPGKNAQNPWDCSSFVNYIVSVKGGKAIPGNGPGKYTGTTHGPPTGAWAAWTGMDTIKRSEVQAGDILVWLGHMGMAINNKEMVHAANPRADTLRANIDTGSGRGPLVRIGRLR